MYNNDSDSLNAGAYANLQNKEGIRLTGNQRMASAPDPTAEMNDFSMQVFGKPLHQLTPPQLDALYELMNEQSKAPQQNSGIMAAAPKGTYTQNRKRIMAAGGGIMGSNNGSMLVAPTADGSRPGYWGLPDWIPGVETIKKIGQTLIPGGETGYVDLYGGGAGDVIKKLGQTIVPGGETGYYDLYGTGAKADELITPPYFPEYDDYNADRFPTESSPEYDDYNADRFPTDTTGDKKTTSPGNPLWEFLKKTGQTIMPGGETGYIDLYGGTGKEGEDPSIFRQAANIGIPLAAGKFAHDYQRDYLAKQPKFPMDETGINFQTARQAMDDPNLRFKPKAQYADMAEGGRIGYRYGKNYKSKKEMPEELIALLKGMRGKGQMPAEIRALLKGVKPGMQEGGLMNLGGMEKDYRQEGGFVPIGGKEKADDVPARLSKNEFVFTADAVRAAGGGDIDQGAEVMENVMKHLEAGGEVSEESQGLEGARGMFANAQQLEKRII